MSSKEDIIRKEAQLEQLDDFIITEEERIIKDLNIAKNEIKNSLETIDFSNLDIKEF